MNTDIILKQLLSTITENLSKKLSPEPKFCPEIKTGLWLSWIVA